MQFFKEVINDQAQEKEFLGMVIRIKKKNEERNEYGKKEEKGKESVGFIRRIIITIVQIRKSTISERNILNSAPRVQSCIVYCSAEFPVTSAFHVESVHKMHSCFCVSVWTSMRTSEWTRNMRINYCKFQGIFRAFQSNQLHYKIHTL